MGSTSLVPRGSTLYRHCSQTVLLLWCGVACYMQCGCMLQLVCCCVSSVASCSEYSCTPSVICCIVLSVASCCLLHRVAWEQQKCCACLEVHKRVLPGARCTSEASAASSRANALSNRSQSQIVCTKQAQSNADRMRTTRPCRMRRSAGVAIAAVCVSKSLRARYHRRCAAHAMLY